MKYVLQECFEKYSGEERRREGSEEGSREEERIGEESRKEGRREEGKRGMKKIITPSLMFISVATRAATDIAATLLGCVHPIFPGCRK